MASNASLLRHLQDVTGIPRLPPDTGPARRSPALARYHDQGLARCRRGVGAFCFVVASMMAANVVISLITAGHWGAVVSVRLAGIGSLGLVAALLLTQFGKRRSREIGLLAVIVTASLMEVLAFHTGGARSVQHDRLSLVILGAAFLVAWGPRWAAATALLVGSIFVGNGLVTDTLQWPGAARQIAYLGASGLLAIVIAAVRDARRWQDFCRDRSLVEARRDVAEREHRYHSLFETAGGAIVVLDRDNSILEFNREAERITGWKRHEVLGRNYLDTFVQMEHRPTVEAVIGKVSRGAHSAGVEGRLRRRDGSSVVLLWNNAPLYDARGNYAGVVGVGFDITARRQANRRIRESEERLRRLMESTNAISWEADIASREPRYLSPQVERIMGFPLERWTRDTWLAQLYPDDRGPTLTRLAEAVASGKDFEHEYRMYDASGRLVWLHDTVSVASSDGVPHTLRGVMIDITSRKLAEMRQRETDARLRMLVETTNAIPWEADAATWRFTYVGPQAERVLGYDAAAWFEDDFWPRHIHPDDREWATDYCRRASRHLRNYQFEYRMMAADGRVVWFHDLVTVDRRDGQSSTLRGFMIDITERKRTEESLRRVREEYEDLYESAPAMLLSIDVASGQILRCNRALAETTGYTRDELLGSRLRDLLDMETVALGREALARMQRREPSSVPEFRVRTKDGDFIDVISSASPFYDDTGRVAYVRSVWRDITDLKRAQEALRQSEARYRHLVDSSQGFICSHDLEGNVLSANPAGARGLGYDVAELVGRNIRETLAPAVQGAFDAYLDRFRRETTVRGTVRIRRRDGEERTWMYRNVLYAEAGSPPYVIGHAQDITDLQRTEAELRASEQRYRAIVEDQTELICRYRRDGRLLFVNGAFCRYFDRQPGDVLDTTWRPEIEPDDLRSMFRAIGELGPERPTCTIEHRMKASDGEERWLLWLNRAIMDECGQPVEYQCVGHDITERRRAEEQIARLARELEDRVKERTEQLRASEELFRSAFRNAPIGVALASETGMFVDTNPCFQRLVGRSDEELRGASIAHVTHPQDREPTLKGLVRLMEGREDPVVLEKRYVRPDGSTTWSDTHVTAIRDEDGGFRYGLAMMRDVTEQKAENAVRNGEKQALELLAQGASLEEALTGLIESLRALDSEMACAITLIDADGRHLRHGAAAQMPALYAAHVDGLEVGPTSGSCGAAAHRRERVIVEDAATDPTWAPYRDRVEKFGLRACWSEPIMSADGTLLGILGLYYRMPRRPTPIELRLLEDAAAVAGVIIERKQSAELLKRHQLELAHAGRVSLVGELAAGLAHDLHQPLAAIATFAGACRRLMDKGDIEDPDQLGYPIEQMRILALSAGEIVRGLRALVQNGNSDETHADLNELIRRATVLVQHEARQHGITVRLDLAPTLPPVGILGIQVEQVVLNLINNAIESMSSDERRGDEILVCSRVENGAGGADSSVLITVRDTGHGLPSGPEKIFRPFFTTKKNGLGMGLTISRSIIESRRGKLWAEPGADGGATFFIRLPAGSHHPTRPLVNGSGRYGRPLG